MKTYLKPYRTVSNATRTKSAHSKFTRLLIGLASLVLTSNAFAKTETVEKNFEVSQGGTLTINSDQGSIDIETWNKDSVAIKVKKKASSQERIDEFKLSFNQSGNDISVDGDSEWNSKVNVQFMIKVPTSFNLDVKTGGGSIEVGDLSGMIKVHTSGGSIKIGNVAEGNVDADTSGGSIKVGDVNGNLKVNTSGGSIKLTSGGGDVKAETSGGSINIGPVTGDVDVDTSGGSIGIAMIDGDVKAETSGGSIQVEGSTGKVNVDTSGGSIKINSSGGPIVAETAGGNIKIKKANGSIDASTAGGSIEAEMIATSGDTHVKLSSSGGDIELYIPASLSASVDAKLEITRNSRRDYRIYSDFPLTIKGAKSDRITGEGDINGGGDKIQLRTTNGDIYIKKIED
jgi:DUF4097 and DUF4098 domain-containing protein YvlB